MSFVGSETWQLRYQRNNKQSGLKNIRCFPACSTPHRLRGFCGNSITFKLDKPIRFAVSFGEFALMDSSTMKVGSTISASDILENERIDDLFKPWHRGEPQDGGLIVFNKQKKGWHYSWVSNKHTSDSEHVFRVYLFEQLSDDKFRCVAIHDSPAFTIFCRRRDKSGVDRLPPQFQNSVNARGSSESEDMSDDDDEEEKPKRRKREAPQPKRAKLSPVPRQSSASSAASAAAQATKANLTVEFADVFRILAALTNVHDRQQQQAEGNSSSQAPSVVASSVTNPTTPSTNEESDDPDQDLLDISKAISDCWDWVTPEEGFGDTQFFDHAAVDDGLFDDAGHIGDFHAAVPDGLRIYHDGRAELTLVEAA